MNNNVVDTVGQVVEVPGASGRAFRVTRGQILRITDLDGLQVADLVVYNAENRSEKMSQGFTRMYNASINLQQGDRLFSNQNRAVWTIVHDEIGVHDISYPPCNQVYYHDVAGVDGTKTGCRDHLLQALEPLGFELGQITDTFNIFMNTGIDDRGRPTIALPRTTAGDRVDLRAEMDLIVAVASCADDLSDCNGGELTRIGVEITPA